MKSKTRQIYMDYASATPIDPRVAKVMQKYVSVECGNPSSIHSLGVSAKRAVEDSRKKIANVLNCQAKEIIFTSGGTEGDNLAVLGTVRSIREKYKYKGGHIITTAIEHQAVLAPCRQLEKEGFEVTYLPVSKEGIVDPEDVKKALRPDTFLVSVMYANNEVGTVQPISEVAKVIRRFKSGSKEFKFPALLPAHARAGEHNSESAMNFETHSPLFHVDACQAPGALLLNVAKLGVDMMTLSGAKIYGPKGVGCLYLKSGVEISPIIYGGGQEKGLRSGTENVAGIVGMAEVLVTADFDREKEGIRLSKLRDYFAEKILEVVSDSEINGSMDKRLPNNLNVYIPDIGNEQLVIELDAIGVAVSSGSACNTNEEGSSHVIDALGYGHERSRGSIRFSLGKSTTKKDIDFVIKNLPGILGRIRFN
ncbi:MAG: cysteine desulfurase family protein [bacterium]|nr:cysteine desulfurase family protein [bacterium]